MDWDKLRIFHAVAEAGSFTHAGDTLNLSQSAISRQIGALEDSLHVPLFHRHARGLVLTEHGEMLNRTVRDVFQQLAMAKARLTESKESPQGALRVNATIAFGSTWLTQHIRDFIERYPEIDVSLIVTNRELDLSMGEAECAIRMTKPVQPDLIQRHLLTVHNHAFAAPEYIKAHGMPASARDLDQHALIVYGSDSIMPVPNLNWLTGLDADKEPRRPVLRVNNVYGIFMAVQSGLGIGSLPDYVVETHGAKLVRVLPKLEGPQYDTFFVYPEELRNTKRIQVFRDFLVEAIAGTRF